MEIWQYRNKLKEIFVITENTGLTIKFAGLLIIEHWSFQYIGKCSWMIHFKERRDTHTIIWQKNRTFKIIYIASVCKE